MDGTVRARFRCRSVEKFGDGGEKVVMSPVYHADEDGHPNRAFWEASPSGSFEIRIDGDAGATGQFEPGVVYDLDITEAPPEAQDG